MKINRDYRVKVNAVRTEQNPASGDGLKFHEIVQKQEQKLQSSHLTQLLNEIESAGERLARSRTFKDLAKFKTLVKRFIKETVDYGMELKQSHSWDQYGQGRSLKIIETIDKKLVQLTEDVTKKEGQSIDILGKIGEIKGLLINLYT
ncbi:YaaR family protein [Bacillaceae bacterium Marseille-Q3522]|nr:YaaR family protein [Bacillaceae bacterium Marseille-Q3522]